MQKTNNLQKINKTLFILSIKNSYLLQKAKKKILNKNISK